MESACQKFPDYDTLGDFGEWCELDSTLGQLGFDEYGDMLPKHVPLVAICSYSSIGTQLYY